MAIFSSHLLDATNGFHAKNVDVIIYQIKKNGDKEIFFETKSDDGGRIHKEFDLSDDDTKCVYCLLYTSPSPRDRTRSRMPSSA